MSRRSPRIKTEEDAPEIRISGRSMSFRLPMQLESLTPSPVDAPVSLSKAWRGVLILEGITMADGGTRHELYVTAAETNGDCRFELWPPSLVVNVTAGIPCLPNLKTWVRANKPVMAMFMPDRLSDPAQHARNKAIFRTFYEVLTEHQIVGQMPWNVERIPGAGGLLYPSSPSVISVAVFLDGQYPSGLLVAQPPVQPSVHLPGISPYTLQDRQYTRFQQSTQYPQPPPPSNPWRMSQNLYGGN